MTNPSALPAPSYALGPGGDPAQGPNTDQFTRLTALSEQTINIPTTAVGVNLWSRAGILLGWSLRETTGIASAVVEFIDGPNANGAAVGEQTILSPISALFLNVDVDVDASAAAAAAANNVTLAGVAGATTFITGFEITGAGATAGSIVAITLTGILGGTKTYFLVIPAGAGVAVSPLLVEFVRPIPASALNTAIVVNVPSFGAGNTNAAVTAHGFQRTVTSPAAAVAGTATQALPGAGALLRSGLFMRVLQGSVTGSVLLRV